MLSALQLEIGTIRQKVGDLTQELPAIRDTHNGVTTILDRLPELFTDVKTILQSVTDGATVVSGKIDGTEDGIGFTRRQLPALTEALERLSLQQGSTIVSEPTSYPTEVAEYIEKRTACLSSLAPVDQTLKLSQILRRSESSCHWIFQHYDFRSWLDEEAGQLIYIKAGPGRGKTTIAAHIVEYLENTQHDIRKIRGDFDLQAPGLRSSIILRFLFQKANAESEGNATAALRSIVAQIVEQVPAMFPYLLWTYGGCH